MNKEIELLNSKLNEDLDKYAKEKDIDKMYVVQTAITWIENKAESITDLEEKIKLIEQLLEDQYFVAAIIANHKIENNYMEVYAQETAELIKKLRLSDHYEEISKKTGYRILDEFELPETYKKESLMKHKENILLLFDSTLLLFPYNIL